MASSGCGSPNRPATWAYISPVIFQPNCASSSCHSEGTAAAGLDFSTPDSGYSSLTRLWVWIVDRSREGSPGCRQEAGTTVCEEPYRPLVTPYDPQQSRIVNMLRARNAPRMPPDRPLDEADIELVERWILNGAKKNESDAPPPNQQVFDASPDAPADAGDASDAAGDSSDADASEVGVAPADASDGGVDAAEAGG